MHPGRIIVHLREGLLDMLSGARRSPALNTAVGEIPVSQSPDPARELRVQSQEILTDSLGADGVSVDYGAIQSHPSYPRFREMTAALRAFDPLKLPSNGAQLAFWINLYNALVLDGIIKLGIRRTVNERLMGFGFFHRIAYVVNGIRTNCDDIEHGILRGNRGHPILPGKQFSSEDPRLAWVIAPVDPRVHFALNCASRSCPPIHFYSHEDLDAQLEIATRNFLSDEVRIDKSTRTITLSRIFKWYEKDFGGQPGIVDFLSQHLFKNGDKQWLQQHRNILSLAYSRYDWRLNGVSAYTI